jgi:hypothetical protein
VLVCSTLSSISRGRSCTINRIHSRRWFPRANSSPPARAWRSPLVPVPIFSWTGCYIGGHIGGGLASKTVHASEIAAGISFTGHTIGFLGGGQVGCNYQFAPNWVIGIEGDGSAANIKGEATTTVLDITGTARAKTD